MAGTRRSWSLALTGPLAPLADGFIDHLTALGYVSSGLAGQRALFGHLDRWLCAGGLGLGDLTPTVLEQFLEARAAERYVTKLTRSGLKPSMEYLEDLGVYRCPPSPTTMADQIAGGFRRYLADERGLGTETGQNYVRVARQFLASLHSEPELLDEARLGEITAEEVTGFVLARSPELSVAAMQTVVGGLRALLGYLYTAGLTDRTLITAVPAVARRRQDLPRCLPDGHVERLLQACDRTTAVGIRDFAILTVLARLGLRANEVAALRLDDIDWIAAEVRIRGKGPRMDRLPLPADVGEALVAYLRHGRPRCADRRVFIRSCAPRRGLSRQAIGGLVRAASVRAGLPAHGPHRLRHTVATGLLRRGAPLTEIAQLLRHQTVQTAVIYAKVDLDALCELAQPWPGATQ
jgi:integrase/recombinase XerD